MSGIDDRVDRLRKSGVTLGPVPGLLGAAMTLLSFVRIDLADWPREAEAGLACLLGLAVFILARTGLHLAFREETPEDVIDRILGDDPDPSARRRATLVFRAHREVETILTAFESRSEPVRSAAARFEAEISELLKEALDDRATMARADVLLRRNLPRLSAAALAFAEHAGRADDVLDIDRLRTRIIDALNSFTNQAAAIRIRTLQDSEEKAQGEIEIFEESLSWLPELQTQQ